MKRDDFLKLTKRVRDFEPMNERVIAALDHPDVQQVLERHKQAAVERAAEKTRRPMKRRLGGG